MEHCCANVLKASGDSCKVSSSWFPSTCGGVWCLQSWNILPRIVHHVQKSTHCSLYL